VISHAGRILKEKNVSFAVWDSGGKGYHLHIRFDCELSKPMIREWVHSIFEAELAGYFVARTQYAIFEGF
jgi:hypothetical protein